MNWSISRKLNLFLSLLILATGSVVGWLFVTYETGSKRAELEKRGTAIVENLAYNAQYMILVEDRPGLQQLFRGLLDPQEIVAGRAVGGDGALLFEEAYGEPSIRRFSAEVVVQNVPFDDAPPLSEVIGRVELDFSLARLERHIQNLRRISLLFVFMFTALATTTTSVIIRRFLNIPMRKLITGMEEVGQGNIRHQIDLLSSDEIGHLAGSFNRMSQNLCDSVISKNLMDNIFESMSDALIVTDKDETIKMVNQRTLELLGYRQEEILGLSFSKVLLPAPWDEEEMGKKKNLVNREGHYLTREGEKIPVLFSRALLNTSDQSMDKGWVCVGVDISERKKFELELQKTSKDLERKNSEFKRLIYIASHDLQEPLRKILTINSRLKDEVDRLSPRGQNLYGRLDRSTEKMKNLIEDLRVFSEIVNKDCIFTIVGLESTVKEVYELAIGDAECVNLKLNIETDIDLVADREKFKFLFYNLFENSYKFRKGSALDIEISSKINEDCRYEINYSDNGTGFSQEHSERIFEPFQRLVEDNVKGTGMGLTICRKVVELHGGEIRAHGKEGEGATFTITLPMVQ